MQGTDADGFYLSEEEFQEAVQIVLTWDRWDRERRLRLALENLDEIRESPLCDQAVLESTLAFSAS